MFSPVWGGVPFVVALPAALALVIVHQTELAVQEAKSTLDDVKRAAAKRADARRRRRALRGW